MSQWKGKRRKRLSLSLFRVFLVHAPLLLRGTEDGAAMTNSA